MKVSLIGRTADAVRVASIGASTCVSKDIPSEPSDKGLRSAIRSGHESVLEHAVYTFAVEGISRACSHQLVRHRMASFSQQSQRYVDMSEAEFIVPPSIQDDPVAMGCYRAGMDGVRKVYSDLIDQLHIPEEDARYILPNACTTNIVVTMNARELRHFFSLRLCARAQWEIRELARQMYMVLVRTDPVLFEGCGPSCVSEGKCHEARPCGRSRDEIEDWMDGQEETE